MADSFLNALQETSYDIGSKMPKIGKNYTNVLNITGGAGDQKTSMSTPATMLGNNPGKITVRPGQSTKYEGNHPGIDIANTIGTRVGAYTGGAVTDVKRGQAKGSPGYGNYIIITDKDGNRHRYSHLDKSLVRIGDEVQSGEEIGTMGNTGQTYSLSGGTGSHLDYRIKNAMDKYIDPMAFVRNLSGVKT